MIGYVMVGSNDIDKSTCFDDSILCYSGLQKQEITEDSTGCAQNKKMLKLNFILLCCLLDLLNVRHKSNAPLLSYFQYE